MILQALKGYYDRKAADPESGIAPEGWEWKEIPFVVVLDEAGTLLQIEDTREGDGKQKRAKRFLVPQGVKKTSGIAANLLWDTANYVLGVGEKDGEKLAKQKQAFVDRFQSEIPDSVRKTALLQCLSAISRDTLANLPQWDDIYTANPNVSFRFDGEQRLYCETDEIKAVLAVKTDTQEADGVCLISGERDKISTLHTAIKGVWGAQSSGANIVSFNLSAFRSFGKEQGLNSPVGEKAMFAYTTAINTLLAKDSKQRIQIGDASTIFWSEKATQLEADFATIFSEAPKDDPGANTRRIKNLFNAPKIGTCETDDGDTRFYVLGLAPNAARIAVRFWKTGTVADFANNIRRHFEDTAIVKPPNEPAYYSLWRMLVNAAVQDKNENIPPNIAGDFMRSILDGTPYPATLLQLVLRRVKSDTKDRVKPVRAALIKAYLNRYLRFHANRNEKEITMALDTEQPSSGYRLGRLFAVLEKCQEEGNPGLNATIRERYYGSACGAPVMVFPTLMRLNKHHTAKIESKGRVVNLERLIGEIVSHIDDFPAHLNLQEQGKFAIGYYHQRQDFFTKKENNVQGEKENV